MLTYVADRAMGPRLQRVAEAAMSSVSGGTAERRPSPHRSASSAQPRRTRLTAALAALAALVSQSCADELDVAVGATSSGGLIRYGSPSDDRADQSDDAGTDGASLDSCTPDCSLPGCGDGCGGGCDGKLCDDGDKFTHQDVCVGATCTGSYQFACDDGNPCTVEAFVDGQGCTSEPLAGGSCSDGDWCTAGDACKGGQCVGGIAGVCFDGKPCTLDDCNPASGCTFSGVAIGGTTCGKNAVCVGSSCCTCAEGLTCDPTGACQPVTSCKGRCGKFSAKAACQCDAGCQSAGTCCADKSAMCENCAPGGPVSCVDGAMATHDTCLQVTSTSPCPYGCEEGAGNCKPDPCYGVSSKPTCLSVDLLGACLVDTGSGPTSGPKVFVVPCKDGETCVQTGTTGSCESVATECQPGSAVCDEAPGMARRCGADGTWQSTPCPGCQATGLANAVACPGSVATTAATLLVRYGHATLTPQGTQEALANAKASPARGVAVYALRQGPEGTVVVLGADETDINGQVTLQVPAVATGADTQVVVAWGSDASDGLPTFAVGLPDPDAKEPPIGATEPQGTPYAFARPMAGTSATWNLSAAATGGALQVFEAMRHARSLAVERWGSHGASLWAWLSEGSDVGCGGACFSGVSIRPGSLLRRFHSQLGLSGPTQVAFADSVLQHELGHWAMHSFGVNPGEGGTHYIGTRVPPGQAWSEGWATFFGAMARGSGLYVSPFSGGAFWVNLDTKDTSLGAALLPFQADKPLLQFIDENTVAAALWKSAAHGSAPWLMSANAPFATALAAPQMLGPSFGRGYTTHVWTDVVPDEDHENKVQHLGLKATPWAAPSFPDYLDALVCLAPALAPALKAQTQPLPFPWDQPLCPAKAQQLPIELALKLRRGKGDDGTLRLRVKHRLASAAPLVATLALPAGVALREGRAVHTFDLRRMGATAHEWRLRLPAGPVAPLAVEVAWEDGAVGLRARLRAPGGGEAPPAAPLRLRRRLVLPGGLDLGRPRWFGAAAAAAALGGVEGRP